MYNAKALRNLNKALQVERAAAHQYQLHAHVLEECGHKTNPRGMVPEGNDAAADLLAGHAEGQGVDGQTRKTNSLGGVIAAVTDTNT